MDSNRFLYYLRGFLTHKKSLNTEEVDSLIQEIDNILSSINRMEKYQKIYEKNTIRL